MMFYQKKFSTLLDIYILKFVLLKYSIHFFLTMDSHHYIKFPSFNNGLKIYGSHGVWPQKMKLAF